MEKKYLAFVLTAVLLIVGTFFGCQTYMNNSTAFKEGVWEAQFYCQHEATKEEIAEDILDQHWYRKAPEAYLEGYKSVDCATFEQETAYTKLRKQQQAMGLATIL